MVPLFTQVLPLLSDCACDVTADVCDVSCGCDVACDPALLDRMLVATLQTVNALPLGLRPNLSLGSLTHAEWTSYQATAYGSRPSDPRIPRLDDLDEGRLALANARDRFAYFTVPSLPADGDGGSLRTAVLLAGTLELGGPATQCAE
jgi:hypothetical protein